MLQFQCPTAPTVMLGSANANYLGFEPAVSKQEQTLDEEVRKWILQ